MLDKLEDVVAPELKGCKARTFAIQSKIEQEYRDQDMVELAQFVEFSKGVQELSNLFTLIDDLDSYHSRMMNAKEKIIFDPKSKSPAGKSPNCTLDLLI